MYVLYYTEQSRAAPLQGNIYTSSLIYYNTFTCHPPVTIYTIYSCILYIYKYGDVICHIIYHWHPHVLPEGRGYATRLYIQYRHTPMCAHSVTI